MSAKHTPGPWSEDVCDYSKEGTGWISGVDGTEVVAYAGCGSHHAEWINPADKALALAAPDLLAALQDALTCFLLDHSHDHPTASAWSAIIAKATRSAP